MRSSWKLVVVVAVVAVVAALGGAAVGASLTSSVGGTSVERVNVVRGNTLFHSSSTTFADIPGATTKITIPPGHHSFLLARFTSQVDCTAGDGSPSASCVARILLGSGEMQPGAQTLDSVVNGQASGQKSGAMDRSSAVLGPGNYIVKVQARVTSPLMILELTNWHLTVERVDTP